MLKRGRRKEEENRENLQTSFDELREIETKTSNGTDNFILAVISHLN